MKDIYITGLYRSATTFCEKKLDSLSNVSIMHQPLFAIFKIIEKKIKISMNQEYKDNYPIATTNYNLNPNTVKKFDITQDDINFLISEANRYQVLEGSNHKNNLPTKKFIEILKKNLKPDYLQNVHNKLIQSIGEYREVNIENNYVGYKEIFCHPYMDYISNPNSLVICMIRDPREIYFSRNYTNDKSLFGTLNRHPVIMIAKIWNSFADFCLSNKNNFKKYLIQYENLNFIDKIIKELINSDTLVTDKLYTEKGDEWNINTSGTGKPGYGKLWKSDMDINHIAIIEKICGKNMEKFNYSLSLDKKETNLLSSEFIEDFSTVQDYCKHDQFLKLT